MSNILKTDKNLVKLEALNAVAQTQTNHDPDKIKYDKEVQLAQCLINCADILTTISINQVEEAVEIYRKKGYLIHGLKYTWSQLRKAFEVFLNASAQATCLMTPSETLHRTQEWEGMSEVIKFFTINEVRFEEGEENGQRYIKMIQRPQSIPKNCLLCKHYKTDICPASATYTEPQSKTCLAFGPHKKAERRQTLEQ